MISDIVFISHLTFVIVNKSSYAFRVVRFPDYFISICRLMIQEICYHRNRSERCNNCKNTNPLLLSIWSHLVDKYMRHFW